MWPPSRSSAGVKAWRGVGYADDLVSATNQPEGGVGDKAIWNSHSTVAVVKFGQKFVEVRMVKRQRERNQRVAVGHELGDKRAARVAQIGVGAYECKLWRLGHSSTSVGRIDSDSIQCGAVVPTTNGVVADYVGVPAIRGPSYRQVLLWCS